MNPSILQAQVTSKHLKSFAEALEDLCQRLPEHPKLNAVLAEAPLDQIVHLCEELDQHLEQLKRIPATSASSASIVENTISTPTAPGQIESAS